MSQPKKPEEGECLRSSSPRMTKKFVKKYGDKLSDVATLVLPSDDDSLVRLREVDDKLWFTDGWHEFVVHYSICAGCLLVFKYEGDSIFNVSIFNLTAYEVDYRDKPVGKEKQFSVSHGKEIENDSCPLCPTFAIRSNVLEGGLDSKIICGNCISTLNSMINIDSNNLFLTKDADNCQVRPQSTQDVGIQFNGSELDGVQLLNQADVTQTKRRKQRNEPSNLVMEMEMPSRNISRMKRDVSHVAIPERERTLHSAGKFKPSNPHCLIVMRPSFISDKCLHVPASFASKYLHGISEFITLEDSNGKQWPFRCIIVRHSAKLSQGWSTKEYLNCNTF